MPYRHLVLLAALLPSVNSAGSARADDGEKREVRYSRDVRPILSDSCFACHGPDAGRREADLRLDTADGLDAARESELLVTGSPERSGLFERIVSDDPDMRMPPPDSGKSLTTDQIDVLRQWIRQGAPWDRHWSYVRPRVPSFESTHATETNMIDRHLNRSLRQAGLTAVGPADRATLLRRLSLDLVGLPPSAEELDDFLADRSDRAYEKVVDRLLGSPHFGERMAIYWLDLVRYADSVGYHKDSHRNVWMYRDWVIDSFNANMPFDRFLVEQLAGDLLEGDRYERYGRLVASGFNRMNQTTSEGGAQAKQYLAIYAADRVRNSGTILFGATLGCAECHDHKYDPFTTRDFYAFAAFFADIKERGVAFPGETRLPTRRQVQEMMRLDAEIRALENRLAEDGNAAERDAAERDAAVRDAGEAVGDDVRRRLESLERRRRSLDDEKNWSATIVTESVAPRTVRVLPRGNWLDDSGPEIQPAIPAFLGRLETGERRPNRLDLARWVVSDENPLTARVMVNRFWQLMFGHGLCRTTDDVGSQGQWPTHPELLDRLAVEFVESGWDVKRMMKRIAMSEAYRRDSSPTDELSRNDPDNRYLARQNRYRLDAELVRDNALAISGLLSRKMGGPSVKPYQPANYWYRLYKDGRYQQDHGADLYRRGLYTYWRRSFWHPSLRAFDAPSREECVARRPRSNTPQQSLVLLNDPTYVEAARVLAASALRDGGSDFSSRLTWMFRRAVARPPDESEAEVLRQLHDKHLARYSGDESAARELLNVGETPLPSDVEPARLAAWTSIARVVLNLHETITRN